MILAAVIVVYFIAFGLTLRWGGKVRDAQRARRGE